MNRLRNREEWDAVERVPTCAFHGPMRQPRGVPTFLWAFALLYLIAVVAAFGADKSGVSPNTISLPKGPGSVEGLGESFQPTLNTGTAKYSVGLKVPPGTAGHAPSLALNYEGGAGNGPLGFGWELPLSFVQRRSDRGIPTYGEAVGFDRQDTFIDTTREELVPQADGFYFCKNEGAFVRYRAVSNHWEATQPDGARLEFGLTADGRVEDAASGRVFSWLLQRETDTHSNTIVYSYSGFPGLQNTNQKYLTSIRYGPGAPPWPNYHFVTFVYEDRPDWFEDCRSGFIVRTGKRLKTIAVGTHGPVLAGHQQADFDGDGQADNLVRKYELDYLSYAGTNSHWSLLAKVTLVGADGATTLPPNTFGYLVSNPPEELSAAGQVIGSENDPDFVMGQDYPKVDLADLNGDGLPDVLNTEGPYHRTYLNRGETNLAGQRKIRWESALPVESETGDAWGFALDSSVTHLADMDGDGLADLVHKAGSYNAFYFVNEGRLGWSERQPMSVGVDPLPAPFDDADVRTADVDFDKRTDLMRGDGSAYYLWFNLGSNRYSERIRVPAEDAEHICYDFSLATVQIADLNGDRIPDVARVGVRSVEVTAGLGYGRFAPPITMNVEFNLSEPEKAKLMDINGDGLADLVVERASDGNLWYWLNLGNYAFGGRKLITGMPTGISLRGAIRWADLNGNGTTDLIYSEADWNPRIRVVDIGELMGCSPAPNTLVSISNGIGRVTLIGYEPSTKFALEDASGGDPWPDVMPFPVSVVASVTTLDSLGHSYATQFRYHDGYYDPVEKQFRGFARVEQVDVGDPTAPTLVTRSHFDTGRDFKVMKGKLLRLTAEQVDGRVFTDETTQWVSPPVMLMTGTNGVPVQYAHPTGSVKLVKELGQGVERRLESEFAYDRYGNETTNANYGIVEGTNRSAFNDERITTTQYAINTSAWMLRVPTRQEIMDEHGVVVSRTESFYDDETFAGDNLGQFTLGNLTLKREWIDPATPASFVDSARSKYDAYGNITVALDPLGSAPGGAVDFGRGHVRVLDYDNRFHAYPVAETIHLGGGKEPLVFQAAYDEGFGTVASSTEFNANTTTYGSDTFARLAYIIRPGDTPAYPTTEYVYALGVPYGVTGLVNHVETRQLDKTPGTAGDKRAHYFISRQYVDGLGRALMSRTESEPASAGGPACVVVKDAVLFNARQKPVRALNPFFAEAGSSTLDELLGYEPISATDWDGLFENDGELVSLDLSNAHQTVTRYDATLRPVESENPDHTFGRIVYEPLLTRTFDENDADPASEYFNTPTVHYQDGLGRLVQVDEATRLNDDGTPSGEVKTWTTRYDYDLNDQLIRITDSQNNIKWMTYDGLKRKTFLNDPNRGGVRFAYDDASNVRETTDAKGQRISLTHDGANRLLTEDYHDEDCAEFSYHRTPDVVYHYDAPVPGLDLGDASTVTAGNTKGKLAWVEDASGEEHTSYDARGRIAWVTKRIPDPVLSTPGSQPSPLVSYATRFSYDSLDRLTKLIYPDQDELSQTYTDRGLLGQIAGGAGGSILTNLQYWASGQQRQIDHGNGVRTTRAHDSRLRLKHLLAVFEPASANRQLINFEYDFDGASNLRAIRDKRPGTAVPAGEARRNTQLFRYDDLYRLTRVQYSFSLPGEAERNDGEINYRHDRVGNMLAQTSTLDHREQGLPVANLGEMDSGGAAGRWNRTGRGTSDPPGPHALTQIRNQMSETRNCSYDANGNMTVLDGMTNTWDFKDRLVAVESAEMRTEYTYDHSCRRVTKRVAPKSGSAVASGPSGGSQGTARPGTAIYVNNFFEIREHDTPVKYVWNGSTRVARVTGSLSTNVRIQRLRLWIGWNLCSLAVAASNTLAQLSSALSVEPSAFRWEASTQSWVRVAPSESLPAGTVLWVNAATNAMLSITGTYSIPTNQIVSAGGDFIASASLAAWHWTNSVFSLEPSAFSLWSYDAATRQWLSALPPPLESRSDLPSSVAPGAAFYMRADTPVELEVPDAALSIRYYHQDHLGSSSCHSDAAGRLVQETAFYPYGEPRHDVQFRAIGEPYQFSQNERDRETRLHYFKARYLAGSLGRFYSVDPLALSIPSAWLSQPGRLHPYHYGWSNPLKYVDPDGRYPLEQFFRSVGAAFRRLFNRPSLEDIKVGQDRPGVLFRADDRPTDEIFQHGFSPRQNSPANFGIEHIRKHVANAAPGGADKVYLVSTSTKVLQTFRFGQPGPTQKVYIMDFNRPGAPTSYDVNKVLPAEDHFRDDREIALHGNMPGGNVVAAYKVLDEKITMNPAYRGPVTSADVREMLKEVPRRGKGPIEEE